MDKQKPYCDLNYFHTSCYLTEIHYIFQEVTNSMKIVHIGLVTNGNCLIQFASLPDTGQGDIHTPFHNKCNCYPYFISMHAHNYMYMHAHNYMNVCMQYVCVYVLHIMYYQTHGIIPPTSRGGVFSHSIIQISCGHQSHSIPHDSTSTHVY